MEEYLTNKLSAIKDIPIDSCVLGCTHYAFAQNSINKVLNNFGKNVVIVDGSIGTSRHLKNILCEKGMLNSDDNIQQIDIYSSDENKLPLLKAALYS